MSLETCLGVEQNIFEEAPQHANQAILHHSGDLAGE
ncbi:hypothetical protein ACPA9J_05900 [Pseudomonas aeruginosa]